MWWENNFLKCEDRKLYTGDREATELTEEFGTPIFLYSRDQILSNFQTLLDAFRSHSSLDIRIHYAMKANPNVEILKILKEAGAWIDAVSPEEVSRALKGGFKGRQILFTGTSLSTEDLQSVFEHEDVIVNIDAEEQLELMKETKDSGYRDKKIKVSIRWNPGIGSGFNPKVVTAGERAPDGTPIKFGVEEKRVNPVFKKAAEYGFIPLGLHQHLGSGWVKEDYEAVRYAVDNMIEKAIELQNEGFNLEFLDFGGGFGPRYTEDQEAFPLKEYTEHICRRISQSRLDIKAIAIEPGKYLVGDAGILLLRVEYVKESFGNLFACVNAGTFNTVPRPAIYTQAQHPIINCSNLKSEARTKITVAGNICETGDVFGKEILLPPTKRGDILAVLCAGAYCYSMASTFNLREIPREIFV